MKRIMIITVMLAFSILVGCGENSATKGDKEAGILEEKKQTHEVWSKEQAKDWYEQWGWLRGANFNPSTAINQIDMWSAETFDPETIDRELGYAESIGFNSMRVYLHHVPWKQDPEGFKKRVSQYLDIADKHGISTMFVFFDDCWNPTYKPGRQPDPKPGVHNSGWVQDPGSVIHDEDSAKVLYPVLEKYVKDVMGHFANDKRIVLWDLYNEPGNSGYSEKSLPLLKKVFHWGREVNPSQPLSAGVWTKAASDEKLDLRALGEFQLSNSDVITYHNYFDDKVHQRWIDSLKEEGRPMLCTEYMARLRNSRFDNIMPMLKKENVGAYNWGLVAGESNTIYAWRTPIPDGSEPEVWFHDIFRKDGTPYSEEEAELIRTLTAPGK